MKSSLIRTSCDSAMITRLDHVSKELDITVNQLIRLCVAEALKHTQELAEAAEANKQQAFRLRLDQAIKTKVRQFAQDMDITMSNLVQLCVSVTLKQHFQALEEAAKSVPRTAVLYFTCSSRQKARIQRLAKEKKTTVKELFFRSVGEAEVDQ